MTDKSQQVPAVVDKQQRRLDRLLRKQIFKRLQQLPEGRIHLLEDGEVTTFGQATGQTDLETRITVLHPAFYRALGFGGSNGAAEAYMDGHWECDDLTKLIRIMARNRQVMDTLESGSAWIVNQINKGWHWFNRNTADGSRRNIAAHYDLGNQLFERVLDDTMMYSCAVFEQPEDDLARASRNKLDRICRKLQLHPGDNVIEIGTGWGGFALHAAEHFGCHVTTTTISQEQYDYTKQRVAARGLQDRITLLLKDYRELSGQFDKLVSIEMVEAVGHQFLNTYINKCSSLLKPDGMLLLQSITIDDQRYKHAVNEVDFIKRYIFPGSFIPSVTAICTAATQASDLKLTDMEDIGLHYVKTLQHWRERFHLHLPELEQLGYDRQFQRMWDFYLAYCEGGFAERAISDVQLLFTKPHCQSWSSPARVLPV